uniref:ANF_receptor domain-containing protein n=1 Tax=Syphacia muris TaxID=451379 RepID=A0A0N5AR15_9BILA
MQLINSNGNNKERTVNGTYKIMVVLPSQKSALDLYGLTIDKVRPVIDVAAEDLYQQGLLPQNYLKFNYFDSKYHINSYIAERRVTVKVFEEYYSRNNLNALLGFADSYTLATVAKVTAGLPNPIPVITTTGRVSALGNKAEYPYLTRMLGNWDQLSEGVYNFLHPVNVTHNIGFFFNDKKRSKHSEEPAPPSTVSSDCYFAMHSIKQYFVGNNPEYRKKWRSYIPTSIFDEDTVNAAVLRQLLKELATSSNTILLCGSQKTLKTIMQEAENIGLIHPNTNYTFINIDVGSGPAVTAFTETASQDDNLITANSNKKAETVTSTSRPLNKRVTDAELVADSSLRHLKTIGFRRTYGDNYYQIVNRATAIAENSYDYSRKQGKPYVVNDFIMSFYDAVMLYALAVNHTLSVGNTKLNIDQLSTDIWSQKFNGTFGEVHFNANGDRVMDIVYVVYNPETGSYDTVAINTELDTSSKTDRKTAQKYVGNSITTSNTLRILNAKLYSNSLPKVLDANKANVLKQKSIDIFVICKYLAVVTIVLSIIALLLFISSANNLCLKLEIRALKNLFTRNQYFNANNANHNSNDYGNNNSNKTELDYCTKAKLAKNPLLKVCIATDSTETV